MTPVHRSSAVALASSSYRNGEATCGTLTRVTNEEESLQDRKDRVLVSFYQRVALLIITIIFSRSPLSFTQRAARTVKPRDLSSFQDGVL